MCKQLPYKDFKFICSLTENDIINHDSNSDTGYIVECDLEYPKELHDLHSDYPLAPENISVNDDMVSDYMKAIYRKYNEGKEFKDEKQIS